MKEDKVKKEHAKTPREIAERHVELREGWGRSVYIFDQRIDSVEEPLELHACLVNSLEDVIAATCEEAAAEARRAEREACASKGPTIVDAWQTADMPDVFDGRPRLDVREIAERTAPLVKVGDIVAVLPHGTPKSKTRFGVVDKESDENAFCRVRFGVDLFGGDDVELVAEKDIAHVLVPRRRVLGYVVREGLERGEGRYWSVDMAAWVDARAGAEKMLWCDAKSICSKLRGRSTPCRIVAVVARRKARK